MPLLKRNYRASLPRWSLRSRTIQILYDGIGANVKKMNETGLRGYFVLGTNGEFKSQRRGTDGSLKTVIKNAAPDKVVMAGTAAESTKETIDIQRSGQTWRGDGQSAHANFSEIYG